jgi:hypothetical protein
MKKKIAWEAWIDPFCSNLNKFHHNARDEESLEENDDNGDYLKTEESNIFRPLMMGSPMTDADSVDRLNGSGKKFLTSSIGIIPMMDHHYIANNFSLWVGHTNFDITKSVADIIEKVEGVETLEIYSRYRFRVSIGKMFDFQEVRLAIENELCDNRDAEYKHLLPDDIKEKVNLLIDETRKEYKYWGICLFPNGETKIITSKIKNSDFENDLSELEIIRSAVDGILYTYQDL